MNPSVLPEDSARLSSLYDRVLAALQLGGEWTLERLKETTGGGEASISARLRELRQDGHPVTKRRAGPGRGTYLYRLERWPSVQLDLVNVHAP